MNVFLLLLHDKNFQLLQNNRQAIRPMIERLTQGYASTAYECVHSHIKSWVEEV